MRDRHLGSDSYLQSCEVSGCGTDDLDGPWTTSLSLPTIRIAFGRSLKNCI